jgi:hypothetical protein
MVRRRPARRRPVADVDTSEQDDATTVAVPQGRGLRWWQVAPVGVIGLGLLGHGVFNGDFSPRHFVDGAYARSHADDIGSEAVAYLSPSTATVTAETITSRWTPGRGCISPEGVYLRYEEDTVVVLRRPQGSLILVENAATSYPRHLSHVAGCWDR